MSSAAIRIGFSATPFKWDKKKIDQVHKYNVKGYFGVNSKQMLENCLPQSTFKIGTSWRAATVLSIRLNIPILRLGELF